MGNGPQLRNGERLDAKEKKGNGGRGNERAVALIQDPDGVLVNLSQGAREARAI